MINCPDGHPAQVSLQRRRPSTGRGRCFIGPSRRVAAMAPSGGPAPTAHGCRSHRPHLCRAAAAIRPRADSICKGPVARWWVCLRCRLPGCSRSGAACRRRPSAPAGLREGPITSMAEAAGSPPPLRYVSPRADFSRPPQAPRGRAGLLTALSGGGVPDDSARQAPHSLSGADCLCGRGDRKLIRSLKRVTWLDVLYIISCTVSFSVQPID